jgi:hypothetical protein
MLAALAAKWATTLASEGWHRLRLAAVDSGGLAGAADYELDVRLPSARGVSASTLMLGVAAPTAAFAPRLVFGDEREAVCQLEVYAAPACPSASWPPAPIASAPTSYAAAQRSRSWRRCARWRRPAKLAAHYSDMVE